MSRKPKNRFPGTGFPPEPPHPLDPDGASTAIRRQIRAGQITGTSRGLAHGFVQCNLAIMQKEFAFDFLLYCQRNQRACPVLEVLEPGDPHPRLLCLNADVRTDCSKYAVYQHGVRQADVLDLIDLWSADLVTFLIGSGMTFDGAFEEAGIPTDANRWVLGTNTPTVPAGIFKGSLVVTMRWLTPAQAITATQVSARFPFNHGAPIHIGDPADIGADLDEPLFGGPVPPCPPHLVPVFWACGVTPQAAAEAANLPIFLAHAPAHSFITDYPASGLRL
ncbi:MAG: DUF1445 domain-containing protein [Hyphomicrobiales bacterium]|nr:DUF1445 domain-containing protein [Hyphomicrobiales bacterium]